MSRSDFLTLIWMAGSIPLCIFFPLNVSAIAAMIATKSIMAAISNGNIYSLYSTSPIASVLPLREV